MTARPHWIETTSPAGSWSPASSPGKPAEAARLVGDRLGPFEILDLLGAGGMGEVYRARDTRLGRSVALKVLPADVLANREGLGRFALEARTASALNHPNIVTIFEIGQANSLPYLAMELVDGWTLRSLMDSGNLALKRTLEIAAQIVEGLAKAHEAGIVHRDLKPENIMVTRDGFVKILDFGLAKLQDSAGQGLLSGARNPSFTQDGFVIGTPDYMSPEQAAGRSIDFRSDQFTVGLILYEMLTHRSAFHRETPVQTLSAIIQDEPESLDALHPRVPPPLKWAIERCLAKDPAERFTATRELARQLKQLRDHLNDFSPSTARPTSQVPPTSASLSTSSTPFVSQAIGTRSELTGVSEAKPTARRARRVREFLMVLALGLALFVAGGYLGQWFIAKQLGGGPPLWKANLLVGPMTRVMVPRISPDGQTLAFATLVGGKSQVAVLKPSSGDWTVLTRRGDWGSVTKVCWSRDGEKVFFDRTSDLPRGIFCVPPMGGEERLVLENALGPEALPDGSLLVVQRDAARNFQLHRFWPETGKLEPVGPAVVAESASWSVRAFPDGKRAIFWGKLAGSEDLARRVYVLDLETGRFAPFAPQLPLAPPLAVRADGTVLAFVTFGDLQQVVAVSPGKEQGKPLFPVTGKPWGFDAATDGSFYVSTLDSPAELLRFPRSGGVPEHLATVAGNLTTNPVELPGGGLLVPNQVLGRRRLWIALPDSQLRPFSDSAEQATPPATLVGDHLVAFLSGRVGAPAMLTVATIGESRVIRRLEATRGVAPQSLAASPDGKTLYYVNAGSLYSVGVEGGTPQKLRSAVGVAVDAQRPIPNLIVQANETDGVKLYQVRPDGEQLPILFASSLRLDTSAISGGAVAPDGQIAVTVTSADSSYRSVALLDPVTARLERVPVLFDGDLHHPAWGRDGSLLAMGVSVRSSLWRFQAEAGSR
jgi:serine/threonine protein kinase